MANHFRTRIQFHSSIAAILLIAISLLGSHERAALGESTSDERAAFGKGNAILTTLHGRDSRQVARKTPGLSVPVMDFHLGGTFSGAGDFRSANVPQSADGFATRRPSHSFRGRAPPGLV